MGIQKNGRHGFYGWKILAVMCIVLFANSGFPMFGGSVINAYMAASLHFDRSEIGLAFALFQFMLALPAPLAAICINKRGVRFTLVLGTLLIVAGAVAMAVLVHDPLEAYMGFGIIIGLGSLAGGPLTAQAGIARWFVKRRALAISLILSGGSIGGLIAPPLLNRIIESFHDNWRVAWWFVAGITFVAALLALFFVKEWPSDLGQLPDGVSSAEPGPFAASSDVRAAVFRTTEQWTIAEVLRTSTFWLLILSGVGFLTGFSIYLAHGVVHLKDLGYTPTQAAFSLSVMTLVSLAGTLLVAGLGDHIEPRLLLAAAMLLFGSGMLLAVHAAGALGLYLYAILLGAGFGIAYPCMMTLAANYFGEKAYPSVLGALMSMCTVTASLGAFGAGYLYDHFGSYSGAFYAVSALCVLSFFLMVWIRPPVRQRLQPLVAGAATAHVDK